MKEWLENTNSKKSDKRKIRENSYTNVAFKEKNQSALNYPCNEDPNEKQTLRSSIKI